MSKKEMEMMMKNAKWLDIVTEEVDEESKPELDYNTPLPDATVAKVAEAPACEAKKTGRPRRAGAAPGAGL